jgi:hypothetical protein
MKWRQWLLIGVLIGLLACFCAIDRTKSDVYDPTGKFVGLLIWLALLFSVSLPVIGIGYLVAYLIRRLSRRPDSN